MNIVRLLSAISCNLLCRNVCSATIQSNLVDQLNYIVFVVADLFCMLFLIAFALFCASLSLSLARCVCVHASAPVTEWHAFCNPIKSLLPLFLLLNDFNFDSITCNLSENHAICSISLRKKLTKPDQTRPMCVCVRLWKERKEMSEHICAERWRCVMDTWLSAWFPFPTGQLIS